MLIFLITLFRFSHHTFPVFGHTFPVFGSHFSGFWVTLFRFLGHAFPVFGSHFSGFWVTLFRFLGHTFPVFGSHFSGFWVTLFGFLGHTFPVFGSSIVPARPWSHVSGMSIKNAYENLNLAYFLTSRRNHICKQNTLLVLATPDLFRVNFSEVALKMTGGVFM